MPYNSKEVFRLVGLRGGDKLSNSNNNNVQNSGISFSGLLTVVFIVLKLTGHIDWSWFWVLSPIWISIALVLIVLALMFIIVVILDQQQ